MNLETCHGTEEVKISANRSFLLVPEYITNLSLPLPVRQVSIERKVLRNVGISDKLQVDRSASQWCTGVLLDHYHVLTAASCVLPSDRLGRQL
ncbi:hypothetical protein E2C01_096236 [Portunus trituberculatus]|uniref:Peptidase S1 domain-containing protein n=1 Tax=Portunus trituberculatus TaxID=210409 RepID=A0A5B7JS49_PORTR|nr:hypothetical protein [Portunus trituberculatus]